MDAARGWSLAIAVAMFVASGCHRPSPSDGPKRLGSALPKPKIRPPLILIPEPAPGLDPMPAAASAPDAGSSAEPEPPASNELRRKSFESLPRPLYMSSHRSGNCGGTLAIDGVGRIWSESGCEHSSTGVVSSERLTAKQQRRFEAALVQLRRLRDIKEFPPCSGYYTTTILLERSGRGRIWRACPRGNVPAELRAVEATWRD